MGSRKIIILARSFLHCVKQCKALTPMNKKIFLILGCLLIVPSVTSAYYSAEEFRVDIINQIRSDAQKQELQDLNNKSSSDLRRELDSYYRTLNNLDKEYEYKMRELELKEAAAKREKDEQRDLLYKTELKKALEEQKKEFEDGAEERANARAKEYCINYDLEHITTGVSPELAALCAKRGVIMRTYDDVKAQTAEVTPVVQKAEITQRQNNSNVVPVKSPKTSAPGGYKPQNYSQPKPIAKATSTGGSIFDTLLETETPVKTTAAKPVANSAIAPTEKSGFNLIDLYPQTNSKTEKKTFFNLLKDRFLGLF